jgi:hypothetical protein
MSLIRFSEWVSYLNKRHLSLQRFHAEKGSWGFNFRHESTFLLVVKGVYISNRMVIPHYFLLNYLIRPSLVDSL